MFWRKRSNLDPADETWLISCWGWLDRTLGPVTRAGHPGLVIGDAATFPPTRRTGEAYVRTYLDILQRLYGIADWPVHLEAQGRRAKLPESVAFGATTSAGALGTFSDRANGARITYDPALPRHPIKLIAVLAHELAHYRLAAVAGDPPGGRAMAEFATDLAVAHEGLGLFGIDVARSFMGFTDYDRQGWKHENIGYLTENHWTFALALFSHQRALPAAQLKPHLKPYLFSSFRTNRAYIDANPGLLTPPEEEA